MSNPWIRLYRESLHDPKIVSLSDRVHRAWHNLLLIADDDGVLPSMRDIAVHLRMTAPEAEQAICDLIEAELVDVAMLDGVRKLSMHGWAKRQFRSDSSTERSRKFREKSNATLQKRECNVAATPPESESEPETESIVHLSSAPRAKKEEQGVYEFWNGRFGRKTDQIDKLRHTAEGLGLPVDELIEAVNRNKARNRPAYFTTLCVNKLKDQVPAMTEQELRDALWGRGNAYGRLCQALIEVMA